MTNEEKTAELKNLLLGKNMSTDSKELFEIVNIFLTNYSVVFYGLNTNFEIRKIKQINIEGSEKVIRITSHHHTYVIPYA